MALPFTIEQLYGVFRYYNTSIWPAQWFLVAMALAAVVAALRPRPWSGVAASAILGVLWAWIALAYHLAFSTRSSPPAYAFAALSMVGAAAFIWLGVIRRGLTFQWVPGPTVVAGAALIVCALVMYPVCAVLRSAANAAQPCGISPRRAARPRPHAAGALSVALLATAGRQLRTLES